uniref:Uncharacterized protein n=1 Tax=Molossus molossus TaxID=27622 RepID=A0A7J8JW90_MOLMO|nr:hypothetical protein HJG59_008130 [Molossus molossus]
MSRTCTGRKWAVWWACPGLMAISETFCSPALQLKSAPVTVSPWAKHWLWLPEAAVQTPAECGRDAEPALGAAGPTVQELPRTSPALQLQLRGAPLQPQRGGQNPQARFRLKLLLALMAETTALALCGGLHSLELKIKESSHLPGPYGSVVERRPCTKRSPVQFLVRAHAQGVGSIPSGGHAGGSQSMFSLTDVSISLSLFLPLSLKSIKGKTIFFFFILT